MRTRLQRVNERIVRNGILISDEELDEQLRVVAVVEQESASTFYFEVVTGVAFRWFADIAVDVVVVEVGLGGRGRERTSSMPTSRSLRT